MNESNRSASSPNEDLFPARRIDPADLTPHRLSVLRSQRSERDRSGLFYTEGIRFVHQALTSRFVRVASLVVAPELINHPFADRLREDARIRGVPVAAISAKVFRGLSLVEEPQGIGAVVHQAREPIHRANPEAGLCWMVLDTVRSTGNLGTLIRAMDAVGGAGLILLGNSIDPYAPEVIRATMGSHFALRYVRTSAEAFQKWRQKHGVTLVGTSPHAACSYSAVSYPERVALWFGTERTGMGEEQMEACDQMVRIPMVGNADSLNLALAGGVLLYEVFHQRYAGRLPCDNYLFTSKNTCL